MNKDVTTKDIKHAYFQAAHIVATHGEKYLPIFERIEAEYNDRQKKKVALTRAIQISKASIIN